MTPWTIEPLFGADDLAAVNGLMRDHNLGVNPVFMDELDDPSNRPEPLYLAAKAGGETVGGLLAETQLRWLKVHVIAVAPNARRSGIATALLSAAEGEAVTRGCRHVYLDSMEYHAPDLYRRLGYRVAGTLDDWDGHGHTKFLFTKDLPSADAS